MNQYVIWCKSLLYQRFWNICNLHSKFLTSSYFSLGLEEISRIWIPQLIFTNSLDQAVMYLDLSSSLTVQREGEFYLPPSNELAENYNYYGTENPLLYNDTYELTFHCHFQLAKYPFDSQHCSVVVITRFWIKILRLQFCC